MEALGGLEWRHQAHERRLVDYLLVAGYDHGQGVAGGGGGGNFPCQGKLLQRFPQAEWKDCPCPEGLEHFCQPQGWNLSSEKLEPKFFISVLTDIHGRRQHFAVLSFSEAVSKEDLEANKRVQGTTADEVDEEEIDTTHGMASMRSRHSRSTSLPRHMVPGVSLPAMTHDSLLFAPKCLMLTSRYDYPELFRNILGVIYTAYSECLVGVGGERIRLETLIGNLLGSVYVPPPGGPQVRFSLGAMDKLTLQPTLYHSVPSTGVKVAMLFKQLGIRNVLTLFSATLTELKILFYSQSFNRLTDACTALVALIYPFKYSHVFIPVLPTSLLEVLNTPTPFIIGVNSIHERDICDLLDVVTVDLDGGAITIPENMTIYPVPQPWLGRTLQELGAVLNPELAVADNAFPQATSISNRKPLVSLDKELRAVLLRLMVQLLEGYRSCLTLVRIHPSPFISFHKAAFLGLRDVCESAFMKRLLDCMFFHTFISERGPPWRNCDIFDEFYSNFGEQMLLEKEDPSKTLTHIKVLAEELFRSENPLTSLHQSFSQKVPQPAEGAMTRVHQPVFPTLDAKEIEDLVQRGLDKYCTELASSPPLPQTERLVPMGQQISGTGTHTLVPNSARRLGVLRNCISSIFENKISEAKKTLPAVISALKTKQARLVLCEELSAHALGNQVLLEHQQFDMIVRLMNEALQDDSDLDLHGIAAALLPLSAIFGRKLSNHGVVQYAYTLIQDHAVWHNQQFWEAAFYNDVQKEIKNLYLHVEDQNSNSIGDGTSSQEGLRENRDSMSSSSGLSLEKHVGPRAREVRKSTILQPIDKSVLELAAQELKCSQDLAQDVRSTRIQREEQAVFTIACGYIDSLIYLNCPLAMAGNREGRRIRDEFENASNSVSNSMAESDSVDAESGFEDQEISDNGQSVIKNVQRFIDKVCSESNLTEGHMKSLHHLIPNNVAMHFEQLESVATQAKRLPPIQKPKINTPSLLPGEDLIIDQGLRVYLLQDGRQDTTVSELKFLPAEGALFLTSYRVIFKGSPIDPFAAEHTITRFFPVTTLSREKRFSINEYLSEIEQQLKEGIQLRSTTFQMIKAAFDEEVTMEEVENFRRALIRVQYPEDIFHFFAFRGIANLMAGSRQKEKNAKYHTIRGFASKTLKNVTKVTGYQNKKRKSSKYLIPNVMPTQGRLSLPEINQDGGRGFREEDEFSEFSDISTPHLPHPLSSGGSLKVVEKLNERSYFKDWIRIGLISPEYNLTANPKVHHHSTESFRVSIVNNGYKLTQSYPALLLVPARISDDSLRRYARCHKQSRFPVITWRHPNNHALLLRGGGYHGRGVMGMIRRHHHDGSSSSQAENGYYDAELYIQTIVSTTPRAVLRPNSSWNMTGSELSLNVLVGGGSGSGTSEYPSPHNYPTLTPNMGRKYNPLSKAMDAVSNTLTRGTAPPKFGKASMSNLKSNRHHGSQSSLVAGTPQIRGSYREGEHSHDVGHVFQQASLYVFMDKNQIKGSKLDAQPKTEFIPVEYPEPRRIRASFKKLMRACVPSAVSNQPDQSFLKLIEASEWLSLLQTLMQIAGAVIDLLDIQGASVMVCLEDGWDITAQVMSIAKLCLDPYYRTIEGFRVLIEQEWLAHGHRFSNRSNLTNPNQDSGFTPIFLQFLDVVHQIHRQFPLSFEFNQFYIRFLAYHYVSCRFRTFLLDNEFYRSQVGLMAQEDRSGSFPKPYRNVDSHSSDDDMTFPSSNKSNGGPPLPSGHYGVNVFDYIEIQASKSCTFQNFYYAKDLSSEVLRPFSHVSDLAIWDYFIREELRHGPAYDLELYNRDIQQESEYNGSDSIASSIQIDREPIVCGYDCFRKVQVDVFTDMLNQIHELESQLGNLNNRWKLHWDNLEVPPPLMPRHRSVITPLEATPTTASKHYGRTMHKRSTMELILKSIGANTSATAATEAKSQAQTHRLEKHNFSTPTYCEVCNSLLWGPVRTGLKCADCGFSCHDKCQDNAVRACTKLTRDSTADNFDRLLRESESSSTSRSGGVLSGGTGGVSDAFAFDYGRQSVSDEGSQIICQGYLYKQANFRIKGWKQRWFVLDSTKHQLRYYDTREDFQCRDKIDLSEITRITESSSPPGAPKKDDALFFDLHTVKRTYCFYAETRQATQEWIHKIQSCLTT